MNHRTFRFLWFLALAGAAVGTALVLFRSVPPASPIEVERAGLILRDGRFYRPGDNQPFSGLMTEFYADGTLRARSSAVNGLLEGVSEGWHTNGQLQVRELFVAGVSHGPRVKWHSNGQELSRATIVEGRLDGVFRRWHENGTLAEEVSMKAGQPDGLARSYYASGFLKAEARLSNGQVLDQHFWSEGERPAPPESRMDGVAGEQSGLAQGSAVPKSP